VIIVREDINFKIMGKEELNSIEAVLFECKKVAFSKIYMPKSLLKKYDFVADEKTKQCYIQKKNLKQKNIGGCKNVN